MRFTSILSVAALFVHVISSPLPDQNNELAAKAVQDYKTVSAVFSAVQTAVNDLTKLVQNFDGDVNHAVPILDSATSLIKTLTEGTTKVQVTDAIGLIDSIAVLINVYTLNTSVDNVVNALIAKKDLFDKAFVTIVVSDELLKAQEGAKALVDAIVAKLPSYIPGIIGTTAASPILAKLDKGVAAFKPST